MGYGGLPSPDTGNESIIQMINKASADPVRRFPNANVVQLSFTEVIVSLSAIIFGIFVTGHAGSLVFDGCTSYGRDAHSRRWQCTA
jgi:hypothetical protein